jgi:phytoene/squalene synthetase
MAAEAERALGVDYRERLRGGLPALDPDQARAVFDEFAKYCAPATGAIGDVMTRSWTRPTAAGDSTN